MWEEDFADFTRWKKKVVSEIREVAASQNNQRCKKTRNCRSDAD